MIIIMNPGKSMKKPTKSWRCHIRWLVDQSQYDCVLVSVYYNIVHLSSRAVIRPKKPISSPRKRSEKKVGCTKLEIFCDKNLVLAGAVTGPGKTKVGDNVVEPLSKN